MTHQESNPASHTNTPIDMCLFIMGSAFKHYRLVFQLLSSDYSVEHLILSIENKCHAYALRCNVSNVKIIDFPIF